MARPASTYRAARHNAGNHDRIIWIKRPNNRSMWRIGRMPPPRYVPPGDPERNASKKHRMKDMTAAEQLAMLAEQLQDFFAGRL